MCTRSPRKLEFKPHTFVGFFYLAGVLITQLHKRKQTQIKYQRNGSRGVLRGRETDVVFTFPGHTALQDEPQLSRSTTFWTSSLAKVKQIKRLLQYSEVLPATIPFWIPKQSGKFFLTTGKSCHAFTTTLASVTKCRSNLAHSLFLYSPWTKRRSTCLCN